MDLFFQELEALTSQQNGQDGQTNSIANVIPLDKKSSNTIGRKPKATPTLQKQIFLFTEEKSTSLQEDSHASPTQQQEKGLEKKMTATSGQKCLEQYEKFSRHGSWAKTFSALLIGMEDWSSMRCRLTWKLKGTKYKRMYFQLYPSTLPTEETGFGLLLTPSTIDIVPDEKRKANRIAYRAKSGRQWTPGSLTEQVFHGILPTPKVGGKEGYETRAKRQGHEKGISHLEAFVQYQMLPTPATRDYKGARSTEALEASGRTEKNSLPDTFHQPGKTSQLNPQFVLEMMGFPPDWTELPFLNGETNPSRPEEMQ